MQSTGVFVGAFLVLACVSVAACGGSEIGVAESDGGVAADGGSGGGGDGGGGGGGGGPGGSCPAALPAARTACTTPGLACEYGGEGDHLLCSVVVNCGQDHTWYSSASGAPCVGSQAENPSACPSSFTALGRGAACPTDLDARCVYPEGTCACQTCSGGDGGLTRAWACETWPDPAGCPEPRPRIGSPCTNEGQECSYGSICGVVSGVPLLDCRDGVWKRAAIAADCALPKCGG